MRSDASDNDTQYERKACDGVVHEFASREKGAGRLLLATEEALCLTGPAYSESGRKMSSDMLEYAKVGK